MKKVLTIIFTLLLMLPFAIFAEGETEKAKVKVYVFEAGGCPYCEAQHEYLQGLEGYNKTFEVISKELYVDHVEWAQGKDYSLGVKVVNTFNKAGYKDASYSGTPLVIISDIYALATYSTNLESVINQAYEEGDKDAVGCIESGKENCVRSKAKEPEESSKGGLIIVILAGVVLIGGLFFVLKNKSVSVEDSDDEEEEEEKPVKKATTKKTPVKKTTKKTPVKKTTKSK